MNTITTKFKRVLSAVLAMLFLFNTPISALGTTTLTTDELQQALNTANVALTAAQLDVENAQTDVTNAQTALDNANKAVEDATAAFNTANANVESAKAALASAQTQLAEAQSAEQTAKANAQTEQDEALLLAQTNTAGVTASVEAANAALTAAQAELTAKEAALASAKAALTPELQATLDAANAKLVKANTALATAQAAVKTAEDAIAAANNTNDTTPPPAPETVKYTVNYFGVDGAELASHEVEENTAFPTAPAVTLLDDETLEWHTALTNGTVVDTTANVTQNTDLFAVITKETLELSTFNANARRPGDNNGNGNGNGNNGNNDEDDEDVQTYTVNLYMHSNINDNSFLTNPDYIEGQDPAEYIPGAGQGLEFSFTTDSSNMPGSGTTNSSIYTNTAFQQILKDAGIPETIGEYRTAYNNASFNTVTAGLADASPITWYVIKYQGVIHIDGVIQNAYSVTYNGSGSTTTLPDTAFYTVGNTVTVTNTEPYLEGHTFNGWRNSVNNQVYTQGQTFNITNNTTLTAIFTANPITNYTVTYNANGGTGTVPATATVQKGGSHTVENPTNLTPPDGKKFAGWSDGANTYDPGDNITNIQASITLTAQWVDDDINIIYLPNVTGFTAPGVHDGTTDNEFTVPSGNYTFLSPTEVGISASNGYTFVKWSTGTADYAPNGTVNLGQGVQVGAVWQTTVTYNAGTNGTFTAGSALATSSSYDVLVGANHTIQSGITANAGYIFTGWKDQDGKTYGTNVTVIENVTKPLILTAQYTAKGTLNVADQTSPYNGLAQDFDNTLISVSGLPANTNVSYSFNRSIATITNVNDDNGNKNVMTVEVTASVPAHSGAAAYTLTDTFTFSLTPAPLNLTLAPQDGQINTYDALPTLSYSFGVNEIQTNDTEQGLKTAIGGTLGYTDNGAFAQTVSTNAAGTFPVVLDGVSVGDFVSNGNYEIESIDNGQLTISESNISTLNLVITADDQEEPYNSAEQTYARNATVAPTSGNLPANATPVITYSVNNTNEDVANQTGLTNVGSFEVTVTATVPGFSGQVTDTFTFEVTPAKLNLTLAPQDGQINTYDALPTLSYSFGVNEIQTNDTEQGLKTAIGGTLGYTDNGAFAQTVSTNAAGTFPVVLDGVSVGDFVSNGNYEIESIDNGQLTINLRDINDLTLNTVNQSVIYNDQPQNYIQNASVTGNIPAAAVPVVRYSTNASLENVGQLTITAEATVSGYNGTLSEDFTFDVTPFLINATPTGTDITYGDAAPTFGYQVTSAVPNATIPSAITLNAQYNTSYDTTNANSRGVGQYTITFDGNPTIVETAKPNENNYAFVSPLNSGSFNVDRANLAITTQNKVMTFGDPVPQFTFTPNGLQHGDTVDMNSIGLDVNLAIDPNAVLNANTTHVITDTALENVTTQLPNYNVTFTPGILEVFVSGAMGIAATGYVGTYDATAHAGLTSTSINVPTATITYSTDGTNFSADMPEFMNAGTYTVYVRAEDPNYTTVETQTTVTIARKDVNIAADSFTFPVGTPDPAFTATVSGLEGNDAIAYSLARAAGDVAGTYLISGSWVDNANYNITLTPGTYTLTPGVAAIVIPPVVVPDDGDDEIVDIPETDTPTTDEPETDDGEDDVAEVEIEETQVPQAMAGSWALLNLILTIITAIISAVLVIGYFTRKKKEEDEENEDSEKTLKRKGAPRMFSIVVAIISAIIFVLTQDMSLPMEMVDQWTIVMAITFVVQIIVAIVSRKKNVEDDEAETQNA